MTAHLDITKRHDAVILFDCLDGNPNGDPDADNQPRSDIQTRHGLVTDACIKRKIRNYVAQLDLSDDRYDIFIKQDSVLNENIAKAYADVGIENLKGKDKKEGDARQQKDVRTRMLHKYFDIRAFGAVLSTGLKAGQVLGPVQITFSRSIDPVFPVSHTITRCAATDAKDGKDNKTMGRKETINYGLYRGHVFYNPNVRSAAFDAQDLELFWEALVKAWEFDRSAARGFMACRGLYVFSHDSKVGNAPTHQLFDTIEAQSTSDTPRSFADYKITLGDVPAGVTLTQLC